MTWGTASPRQGQLMPGHTPHSWGCRGAHVPRPPQAQAPATTTTTVGRGLRRGGREGRPHQLPLPMAEASGIRGVHKGSHPWEAARGFTHEAQMVKNFKTVMAEHQTF